MDSSLACFKPLVLTLLAAGAAACTHGNLVVEQPGIEDASDQMATCKVARDPLNPIIIEWPATSKAQLESKSADGVVVVSYLGCHLKVLTGCDAGGGYALRATQPARDKVRMANESELNAKLPLGFAELKGRVASGNTLELDFVAVGERVADKPPAALSGSCEGATHYVRAMTVGAYSLDAVGTGELGGEVTVGGMGAGAGRKEARQNVNHAGDVARCADAGGERDGDEHAGECAAILQLSLQPLRQVGAGSIVSAGFGTSIGPMGDVPTVPESDIQLTATSLKDVDVTFLGLLQDAKRADKQPELAAKDKADKWSALCSYDGKNPVREESCVRRDEWQEVADAERKREEQLASLRAQYEGDKAKLEQLVTLDVDIVSDEQKRAYRDEFEQVYAPYRELLAPDTTLTGEPLPPEPWESPDYANSRVAIDAAGGYYFARLGATDDPDFLPGLRFPATGTKDGEDGGLVRLRIAGQIADSGFFIGATGRVAIVPDWTSFTIGPSFSYRPAFYGFVPELGLDFGYLIVPTVLLEDAAGTQVEGKMAGLFVEGYAGLRYLVAPFLSLGAMGGVQYFGVARSGLALGQENVPVLGCKQDPNQPACQALTDKVWSSGIGTYAEGNVALHF